MTEEQYFKERVDDQISWFGKKSATNKRYHIWSNSLIILGGAMIPFVMATSIEAEKANLIAAGLGVLTAFLSGVSALMKFNEKWTTYRTTAEALRREKVLFKTACGAYSNKNRAFQVFVHNVESMLSDENSNWAQLVSTSNEG